MNESSSEIEAVFSKLVINVIIMVIIYSQHIIVNS